MKDIDYTCETRILPGREGESVKAIRLDNTETVVYHVTQGEEYGPELAHTKHFMSGPVADKLYAYENLGYSPEELKGIIRELKVRRDVANTVYGKSESDRLRAIKDYIDHDISITSWASRELAGCREWQTRRQSMKIEKVIFNNPATIVIWHDGTKTVVKATNEEFDPEKGLAMAISKRALGDNHGYYDVFKKHLKKYEKTSG